MRRWGVSLAALLYLSSCKEGSAPEELDTEPAPPAAVLDLGAQEVQEHLEGFFAPERVGRRNPAWSQGRTSLLSFELKPEPRPYLLTLLLEPYVGAQPLTIELSLNDRALGELEILPGWRAYQRRVDASLLRAGANKLVLGYSKTARPADVEANSPDVREIAVRVDQVQLQPISDRMQLALEMKSAFSRAAMSDGWGVDENDRYAGVWTLGTRALLNVPLSGFAAPSYALELTAQAQPGLSGQSVRVRLNGTELGSLRFDGKRSTQRLAVSKSALAYDNVIELVFDELTSPSDINPQSNDRRLLGLRVLRLDLAPE